MTPDLGSHVTHRRRTRHPLRRRGFSPAPTEPRSTARGLFRTVWSGGGPSRRENRVGKSKSDVEKGGIQTATVKAPGRRNQGVKNIEAMATGRSVLRSPGYKLELVLTDPEAHGQAKSAAAQLPGPQPLALCSPRHTPGQNPSPALRFPGDNGNSWAGRGLLPRFPLHGRGWEGAVAATPSGASGRQGAEWEEASC